MTAAQAAFTDLKNQVSTAQSATNGESAQILAQTPTGFPGNWQVFLAARTNATNARTDLRAAYGDARAHPDRPAVGVGAAARPYGRACRSHPGRGEGSR